MSIAVSDPTGAAADSDLPSLAAALDPATAAEELSHRLRHLAGPGGSLDLRAIRVVRHKAGRRCLIEYDLDITRPDSTLEQLTAIGKVRVRRFGKSGFRLLDALWKAGFDAASADGISVPEPLGTVSAFRMWLQRKVPGRPASELLAGSDGEAIGRRIAEAAHKLHRAGVPPERRHTMADELDVLATGLTKVGDAEQHLAPRVERLLAACRTLAERTAPTGRAGIHRDFYADQVIVDPQQRLYLLDFDLYCEGDPALDIGNFLGHVTEQSLRMLGDHAALQAVESAIEERYIELAGLPVRPTVHVYATLTLARHVYLSTVFDERREFTERILELCEQRLAAPARVEQRP